MPPATTTSYGQGKHQNIDQNNANQNTNRGLITVIEYIQDRLYLASYTHPPDANTPFPYPRQSSRSPSKRSSKAQPGPVATGPKVHPPVYFTIDKTLLYNAFHGDFGPLHIGHLYRYAVQLHEVLGDPANEERGVVFWSNADSRSMFALIHERRERKH